MGDGPEALIRPEFERHMDELLDDVPVEEEEEDKEEEEEGDEGEEGREEDEGRDRVTAKERATSRRGGLADAGVEDEGDEGRGEEDQGEDGFPAAWPLPVGQRGVEDRFMKLSEMERFLEDAEAKVGVK